MTFDVQRYERKVHSQFGEDGVLLEIVRRLNPPQTFVEFGVDTGEECCTRILLDEGWRGVMFEPREDHFPLLVQNMAAYEGRVLCGRQFFTTENIRASFSDFGVRERFGVLSIDVDGNDYHLWKALCAGAYPYAPWIVVIEVNQRVPPGTFYVHPYDPQYQWDGGSEYGASLTAMTELASAMGYALVGATSEGVNAFYIREHLVGKFELGGTDSPL